VNFAQIKKKYICICILTELNRFYNFSLKDCFFIYQEHWFVSGDGVHIWLFFIFLCHVFDIIFDLKAKIFLYTSNNGLYQVLGFTFACFWLVYVMYFVLLKNKWTGVIELDWNMFDYETTWTVTWYSALQKFIRQKLSF